MYSLLMWLRVASFRFYDSSVHRVLNGGLRFHLHFDTTHLHQVP